MFCFELGYEVTALDVSERRVAEATDYATLAARDDGADKEALIALGVGRSDVWVVARGQNTGASISYSAIGSASRKKPRALVRQGNRGV